MNVLHGIFFTCWKFILKKFLPRLTKTIKMIFITAGVCSGGSLWQFHQREETCPMACTGKRVISNP